MSENQRKSSKSRSQRYREAERMYRQGLLSPSQIRSMSQYPPNPPPNFLQGSSTTNPSGLILPIGTNTTNWGKWFAQTRGTGQDPHIKDPYDLTPQERHYLRIIGDREGLREVERKVLARQIPGMDPIEIYQRCGWDDLVNVAVGVANLERHLERTEELLDEARRKLDELAMDGRLLPKTVQADWIRAKKLASIDWDEKALYPLIHCNDRLEVDMTAKCNNKGCVDPPQLHCTCGFYAMKQSDDCQIGQEWTRDRVLLDVELGGRVIKCQFGYRAQRQRILKVWFMPGYENPPDLGVWRDKLGTEVEWYKEEEGK